MKNKTNWFKTVLQRIYGSGDMLDIEKDRKVLLLNLVYTLGIVFLTPYIFIAYSQGSYLLSLFDFFAVILMALTFLYLRHTKDYQLAAYFGLSFIGALSLYVIASGGVSNTGPLWTYAFPMLLMFLLGLKKGTIGFGVFLFIVLLIFFLPGAPLLLTTYTTDFKVRFISTYVMVFAIAFFYEWVRAKTHDKIAAKTMELEKALTELKTMEEERTRLQNKLLAAKKMEAIGTLAGGMAHELNNQITIVSGNTDLLLMVLSEDKQFLKKLKAIKTASSRISMLTNQLLSFSRLQILQLEIININELIQRNMYAITQAIGKSVELILNLEPMIWDIKVDTGLIIQMIMDLVINARDAMPGSGKLTINTGNILIEDIRPNDNPEKKKGQFVCLTVQDTGVGMDNETAQKIFEPFFTTKKLGEGTGLGLSSAYGIIKQHNGWIDVSSEPGQGTTLKVYLPAYGDPPVIN